jgi:hypothetical protein
MHSTALPLSGRHRLLIRLCASIPSLRFPGFQPSRGVVTQVILLNAGGFALLAAVLSWMRVRADDVVHDGVI